MVKYYYIVNMLGSLRFMNQNDFKQKVAATKCPKNFMGIQSQKLLKGRENPPKNTLNWTKILQFITINTENTQNVYKNSKTESVKRFVLWHFIGKSKIKTKILKTLKVAGIKCRKSRDIFFGIINSRKFFYLKVLFSKNLENSKTWIR